MLTILFDGIAYGMLLFLIASGLAVTLGLMNFVNLAHGAFAMAGGYVAAVLSERMGVPFLLTLPLAFMFSALLGAILEPTLYRRLYARPHLDQVLFSIGLVFMAVAATDYAFGATQVFAKLPPWLRERFEWAGAGIGAYRLFIIVVCGVITLALQWTLARTRFGSQLRAAVDDRRTARGLGIRVNAVFLAAFAAGSGLAGLGGALGAELLGLDPTFPLKYMIYFLVVVAVGGTTTITGPLAASLLLGIADVAGKYYVPKLGAFIIYCLMIAILYVRPQGLFARAGSAAPSSPPASFGGGLGSPLRIAACWRGYEIAVWVVAVLALVLFPRQAALWNEIAILALFAVSLDLILGYGGIVSLGHAAFFGAGCYAAALVGKHFFHDPVAGLAVAASVGAVLGLASSVFVLRGSDLTRLIVTLAVASILYELANKFDTITGGADGLQGVVIGPLLGVFEFGLDARTASAYSLAVLFLLVLVARRVVHSPFGYSLKAIRDNRLRATATGIDANRHLAVVYTLSAAMAAAAGGLHAQTNGFASLDVLGFDRSADVMLVLVIGGTGYLYGGVIGAGVFKVMQDLLSAWTPQYWQFWLGLVLVAVVLVGHERLARPLRALRNAWERHRGNGSPPPATTLVTTASNELGSHDHA
jgi:branched-chain amino acid transport system permease protein